MRLLSKVSKKHSRKDPEPGSFTAVAAIASPPAAKEDDHQTEIFIKLEELEKRISDQTKELRHMITQRITDDELRTELNLLKAEMKAKSINKMSEKSHDSSLYQL